MWLSFVLELIARIVLPEPAVLGAEPVTFGLGSHADRPLGERLDEAVRSPSESVVLVLGEVRADARPEVSWEVYVAPAGAATDPEGPQLVGIVALFDRGIASAGRPSPEPAKFVFVLDRAIAAAGSADLQVTFAPAAGIVVDGRPQAVEVRSRVTIGEISLAIDAAGGH